MFNSATFKDIFKPLESDRNLSYSGLPEETTAQKIYKLRMVSGYTQREFAKVCSIGYSSVCKYETGWKPSNTNLKKICSVFKLNLDYFF